MHMCPRLSVLMLLIGGLLLAPRLSTAQSPTVTIALSHYDYPVADVWTPLPQLPGGGYETVDGNAIRVEAQIMNDGGVATLQIEISEATSGDVLLPAQNLSLGAGEVRTVAFEWDTYGYAWAPGNVAQSNRQIRVDLIQNESVVATHTVDIKVKPRPIVWVHGFNENNATGADRSSSSYADDNGDGFLRDKHPDWALFYVTGMNTGGLTPPATGDSQYVNAVGPLREGIDTVREATNAWQVDLIGYSLGGVIARAYMHYTMPSEPSDGDPPVHQLVMLATPNLGTPCAVPQSADLRYLSPDFMWYFNQVVTDYNGTVVAIITGGPDQYTVNPCSPSGEPDYAANICGANYTFDGIAGPTDGIVPVESAFAVPANLKVETDSVHSALFSFGGLLDVIVRSQTDFDDHVFPQLVVFPGEATAALSTDRPTAPIRRVSDAEAIRYVVLREQSLTLAAGESASIVVSSDDAIPSAVFLSTQGAVAYTVTGADGTTRSDELPAGVPIFSVPLPRAEGDTSGGTATIRVQNRAAAAQTVALTVFGVAPVGASDVAAQDLGTATDPMCQDPNFDGFITPTDGTFVINRLGTAHDAADIDADGTVDADDAALVLGSLGRTPIDLPVE